MVCAAAGVVEQVPGDPGSVRKEVIELPRPDHDRLHPALVPSSPSIGGSEIVSKGNDPKSNDAISNDPQEYDQRNAK